MVSKLFVTNQYATNTIIAALIASDVIITTIADAWSKNEYDEGKRLDIRLAKNKMASLNKLKQNVWVTNVPKIPGTRLQNGLQNQSYFGM